MPSDPITIHEQTAAAGRILQNAALNEHLLCLAFRTISGCEMKLASAIFYTLDSLPAKKSLLMRVLEVKGDAEDKRIIKTLIDAAETANNQRKQIAHAILMWENPELKPDFHVYRPKSRELYLATKDSMATVEKHSQDALSKGIAAFQTLCEKHAIPANIDL